MIDRPARSQTDNDPDIENSEQDDEPGQSQSVADEALRGEVRAPSPLDSIKVHGGLDGEDEPQDLIDRMRDMEQSGRIDMGAFEGEPNLDDNKDEYGEGSGDDEGADEFDTPALTGLDADEPDEQIELDDLDGLDE